MPSRGVLPPSVATLRGDAMARTPLTRTPLARTLPLRAVTAGRRPLDRPGTVPRVPHGSFLDAVVDWALYADGRRQPPQAFETACETARTGSGFLWLGLHEPTAAQLEQLGTTFGLSRRAVEDAEDALQRPTLERYD